MTEDNRKISRRAVVGAAAAAPLFSQSAAAQQPSRIRLVILDMGGTLIQDHGEVPKALSNALSKRGVAASNEDIAAWRGASKRGMVRHFVERSAIPASGREAAVAAIYADFERQTESAYADVQPIAGAEQALQRMRSMGLLLATTTGFGRALCDQVIRHLNWKKYFVTNVSSDDVEDGRPAPFMLFRAMEAAHVDDVREVAVVGDTVLDLQAGNNAGARVVIGVWSGAATVAKLRAEKNTALLPSVAQLPNWLVMHP